MPVTVTIARDPRPSQAEVEAMADVLFGAGWKDDAERAIREGNAYIAARLDAARAAVLEQR